MAMNGHQKYFIPNDSSTPERHKAVTAILAEVVKFK